MDDADKVGARQGRARDWSSCQGNALARGILKTLKYCPQKAAMTHPRSHSTRQRQSWGRIIGTGLGEPPASKDGTFPGQSREDNAMENSSGGVSTSPHPRHPTPHGAVLTFLCSSLEDACILPRGKEFKIGTVCFCGSRREKEVMIWKLLG